MKAPEDRTDVRAKRGFTLLELLVTVVVITILIMLIFTGVKAAIETGREAVCAGNLKNISSGMHQFVADNNGAFPQFIYGDVTWVWKLLEGKYIPAASFQCPSAPKINLHELTKNRWAWDQQTISYGYNYRHLAADVGAYWNPPNPIVPVKLVNITRPSTVILMMDAIKWWNYKEGTGSGFYLVQEYMDQWANPATRHRNRANVLWVDGHVSPQKWDRFAKPQDYYKYLEARNWNWRLP